MHKASPEITAPSLPAVPERGNLQEACLQHFLAVFIARFPQVILRSNRSSDVLPEHLGWAATERFVSWRSPGTFAWRATEVRGVQRFLLFVPLWIIVRPQLANTRIQTIPSICSTWLSTEMRTAPIHCMGDKPDIVNEHGAAFCLNWVPRRAPCINSPTMMVENYSPHQLDNLLMSPHEQGISTEIQ